MPTTIGPQVCIDIRQTYTSGQSSVVGPIAGNATVAYVVVTGDTGTVPALQAGSWDGTTFTSAATLVNGGNGTGGTLGANSTLQNGAPTTITILPSSAITSGQFLRYTSASGGTFRVQIFLNGTGAVAGFAVNTASAP